MTTVLRFACLQKVVAVSTPRFLALYFSSKSLSISKSPELNKEEQEVGI